MKTLITPLIDGETGLFALKEGLNEGDGLIVLVPEKTLNEGLGVSEEELNALRHKLDDLQLDIQLEKKVLDTGDFEALVREVSRIFMNIEGEIVVNLSTEDEHLLIALTICSTFYGDSIRTFYTHPSPSSRFNEIEFPYTTAELTENEEKLLELVARKGPLMMGELDESVEFVHSKSTISRIIKNLEDIGLVKTRFCGKDKEVSSTLTGDVKAMTL